MEASLPVSNEHKDVFESPFYPGTVPGFHFDVNLSDGQDAYTPVAYADASAAIILETTTSTFPKIGASCKKMFFCQPPIKHMDVYFYCRYHSDYPMGGDGLSNEKGLTLDDLYDEAERIMRGPELCRRCEAASNSGMSARSRSREHSVIRRISFDSLSPHYYVGDGRSLPSDEGDI